jgi:hypothetical protein
MAVGGYRLQPICSASSFARVLGWLPALAVAASPSLDGPSTVPPVPPGAQRVPGAAGAKRRAHGW